jgi:hypothetical protein
MSETKRLSPDFKNAIFLVDGVESVGRCLPLDSACRIYISVSNAPGCATLSINEWRDAIEQLLVADPLGTIASLRRELERVSRERDARPNIWVKPEVHEEEVKKRLAAEKALEEAKAKLDQAMDTINASSRAIGDGYRDGEAIVASIRCLVSDRNNAISLCVQAEKELAEVRDANNKIVRALIAVEAHRGGEAPEDAIQRLAKERNAVAGVRKALEYYGAPNLEHFENGVFHLGSQRDAARARAKELERELTEKQAQCDGARKRVEELERLLLEKPDAPSEAGPREGIAFGIVAEARGVLAACGISHVESIPDGIRRLARERDGAVSDLRITREKKARDLQAVRNALAEAERA